MSSSASGGYGSMQETSFGDAGGNDDMFSESEKNKSKFVHHLVEKVISHFFA